MFQTLSMAEILIILAVALVLLAVVVWLSVRQTRLENNYNTLMRSADGLDFNSVLIQMAADLDTLTQAFEVTGQHSEELANRLFGSFDRMGLVHYESFEGVPAHNSFCLCLLDERDNGFILTALAARDQTRCYCKSLREGTSDAALSEEEKRALLKAQGQPLSEERP